MTKANPNQSFHVGLCGNISMVKCFPIFHFLGFMRIPPTLMCYNKNVVRSERNRSLMNYHLKTILKLMIAKFILTVNLVIRGFFIFK